MRDPWLLLRSGAAAAALLTAAGCTDDPEGAAETMTEGSTMTTAPSGFDDTGHAGATTNGPNPTTGVETGPVTDGGGDASTGSDSGCGPECESDPHVVWIGEPDEELLGGRCLDVMSDGQGGAIASFDTNPESVLAGGLVLALGEDGTAVASRTLEQRQVAGLQRTGSGSFRWVDTWANVGESDTQLGDLSGQWLADDLLAIDDLEPIAGGYAYASIVNGFFPECRIRLDTGAFVDSPSLPCGTYGERWRLRPTAEGSIVAGLTGQSALAHVTASGDLIGWVEWRYQRTMLDLAVDPQGRVWTVGIVRNPNEAGPSYGSFVARHDPGIHERPQWEVADDSDGSLAWTAIVMWQGTPILVGRDADDRMRLLALTSTGDADWEMQLELPPSVLLRHADVDDRGRLLLCGDEVDGDVPVAMSSPVLVRVDL